MNPMTYIALSGISIIPTLLIMLFPQNRAFFDKSMVKGFGLGVYLMLVVLLLRESIENSSVLYTSGWFISGLMFSLFIGLVFKEFHHHHTEEDKAHSHNTSSTWRLLISDFFHNIVDGIAVIASFSINMVAGITTFAGVLGHQIIQQGGQQILLIENKIKPKNALGISFIVSLSIFLGFLFQNNTTIEVILMALSGGIVAWKVATDMIHTNWSKKMILGFMFGALMLALILVLVPHGHS